MELLLLLNMVIEEDVEEVEDEEMRYAFLVTRMSLQHTFAFIFSFSIIENKQNFNSLLK